MIHVDWQQIVALGIVAVAAFAVGKRMWGPVVAFRGKPGRGGAVSSGCDGCLSSGPAKPKTASSPLMQIQTKPPLHLRRPPGDGD